MNMRAQYTPHTIINTRTFKGMHTSITRRYFIMQGQVALILPTWCTVPQVLGSRNTCQRKTWLHSSHKHTKLSNRFMSGLRRVRFFLPHLSLANQQVLHQEDMWARFIQLTATVTTFQHKCFV